jgi:glycosyltransferase involved in cell wall biosynthesis
MPVFNGETCIRKALDSLFAQTFGDFELIISDNASTDATGKICLECASRDSRIRYVRQRENIGVRANYKFVLDTASAEYFMWAAVDDIRSPDFLEANVSFLDGNPKYLGSTSPVRFAGGTFDAERMGDAPLAEDDRYDRIIRHCSEWHANGRFYSLFRRDAVAGWTRLEGADFLGSDWTLIAHLASGGKLNRVERGWVELGVAGMSNTTDVFALHRKGWVDWLLPFNALTAEMLRHMKGASVGQKLAVLKRMARLNGEALRAQYSVARRRRKASHP